MTPPNPHRCHPSEGFCQVGTVRDDLPGELLTVLFVGADEAGDCWFVDNWKRLGDDEVERLFAEVFGIFRRMLEPPPA